MQRLLHFFSCSETRRKNPNRYRLLRVLGVPGTFGTVYLGEPAAGAAPVAIKQVPLRYKSHELDIFRTLVHPNVVRYLDSYESKKHVYIVMEKCEQDLFDVVVRNGGKLPETRVVRYATQVLKALEYLHQNGIVHGDLKLCNVMVDATDTIKLIDFGTAQRVQPGEMLHEFVGSVGFLAPEVIQGAYTTARDMWSLGCVVFILLFGHNPFNPNAKETDDTIFQNILKGYVVRDSSAVSPVATDFIRQLLVSDWHSRLTAKEALQHPWLNKQ